MKPKMLQEMKQVCCREIVSIQDIQRTNSTFLLICGQPRRAKSFQYGTALCGEQNIVIPAFYTVIQLVILLPKRAEVRTQSCLVSSLRIPMLKQSYTLGKQQTYTIFFTEMEFSSSLN